MRFASIQLHSMTQIDSNTNPLGATALFQEGGAAAIAEAARTNLPDLDGIVLQRFHGSLDKPVVVGVRPDLIEVETYVGSPEDRRITDEEIKTWASFAAETRLVVYTTMPRSLAGFDELNKLAKIGLWAVIFDVAGQNDSLLAERAVLRVDGIRSPFARDGVGGVPEPTPLPEFAPSWLPLGKYTAAMAERWRTLDRRRALPSSGMVIYNGNRDGDSYWDPEEAAAWEERGFDVSGPMRQMFPATTFND